MTPLASKFAHKALASHRDDAAGLCDLFPNPDLHCFEVSKIAMPIWQAMDDHNVWPEVETMASRLFLPSPVTWLEFADPTGERIAWVIREQDNGFFSLVMAFSGADTFAVRFAEFRVRGIVEVGERFEIKHLVNDVDVVIPDSKIDLEPGPLSTALAAPSMPQTFNGRLSALNAREGILEIEHGRAARNLERAKKLTEVVATIKHGIAFCILALDLINTPGLIGLRQHDPHRGLARRLAALRSGSFPLRGWSEVTLKHEVRTATGEARLTGPTFHKCFHFVRSHQRHYRDGRTITIPAHWRGDPALGIKQTRYVVAP